MPTQPTIMLTYQTSARSGYLSVPIDILTHVKLHLYNIRPWLLYQVFASEIEYLKHICFGRFWLCQKSHILDRVVPMNTSTQPITNLVTVNCSVNGSFHNIYCQQRRYCQLWQVVVPKMFCLTVTAMQLQVQSSQALSSAVTLLRLISSGQKEGSLQEQCQQ